MNTGSRWTPEDDRHLSELRASGVTWQKAARALGRTEAATMEHAARLRSRRANTHEVCEGRMLPKDN